MLTPSYLTDCSSEIDALFAQLEIDILSDIARRIKENKYSMTSTAQHQLNREQALGLQYDDMQKRIAEMLDVTEKKVAEIIPQSSYHSIDKDNVVFKHAYDKGIISKFNYDKEGLTQIILAGIKSTNGEIRNICKSTAKSARNLFSNQLDIVYLAIQSGAISQQEAIANAARTIGKSGIQWIDYKSGAHRRVDTAIRNAIRTGVNQTACRCQDKNFEDMGGNLVITSSHMGARPSHAMWQGEVFWRKKQYKNYRNFEMSTQYGSGDGLGGWGCRHGFYPYFEGLSSKAFEHYNENQNEERYELEQEQRYNERMIREWKRRSAVNLSAGVENSKEARKVNEWQSRQRALLKKHPDMKRNYARESIEKRSISAKEITMYKNNLLSKGYNAALKKGDISSFVTYDIYKSVADKIDKELVGLKTKDGIIIKGYKTHFIDRQIGQYESSNEPIKGLRQGVPIESLKECLLNSKEIRKKSDTDWNYINEDCKITLNPRTGILIQTNLYRRKKVK